MPSRKSRRQKREMLSDRARRMIPGAKEVPSEAAVARFLLAVRDDPTIAIEVLGYFRSASAARGELPLTATGIWIALILGISTVPVASIDDVDPRALGWHGGGVGGLVLLGTSALLYSMQEAHAAHAATWLAAYEDGLALDVRVRRRRVRSMKRSMGRELERGITVSE